MKQRRALVLPLILSFSLASLGQTPSPAQPQKPSSDDEVVRISTNLVQFDAVVTDRKGKVVTDLQPEEVEILEDGRPQKLTNLVFVSNVSGNAPVAASPAGKLAPLPPVRLRPEQVKRTIALVVDDLGLSFVSTHFVRRALKKFVDEQMQPGDLVAIIRTGGGIGALQQFTSDKRQLYAAIERVRFSLSGRGIVGAFGHMQGRAPSATSGSSLGDENDRGIVNGEDPDQFREEIYTVGTLGAINYVVRGMRELPGRKSILLMHDGINISSERGRNPRVTEAFSRLTDLANRASVVIYTMDARGLQTLGLEAADDTAGIPSSQIQSFVSRRRREFYDSGSGADFLANRTGGFTIQNENDLSGGIKRVLQDQSGYYLVGYRPDESTFDAATGRRKFHKVSIKVNRPGLSVRTRAGFYGIPSETAPAAPRTRGDQLLGALSSPFASGGIHLQLTALFGNDAKEGTFLRSLLHINARDLTFTAEPNGWHKAVFDVLAVTFGDNGMVIDHVDRIHTVRLRGEAYKQALLSGLIFTLTVPIKKPGAYQLRTSLRDVSSERVGSASQFIEVPDIKKNRLTLSGIAVNGIDPSAKPSAKPGATINDANIENSPDRVQTSSSEEEKLDPQAGPAVRKFRRGMVLQYAYKVYNAQIEKAMARPQAQTQMRLFREGKEIFTGQALTLDSGNQPDLKRLTASGALQLATDMTPGEYILQITVTDPLAKTKYRTATQWIDFEIVE